MQDTNKWDWETPMKKIPFAPWQTQYRWVEEPYSSPDGENIAAIVNIDEGEFNVCVNGELWDTTFDKIWYLRFAPDNRLTALVSDMGEWTVAVDGAAWDNKFGYVWNTLFSHNGNHIAVAFQNDQNYGMAVDNQVWEQTYPNMTYMTFSHTGGHTAATVQVKSVDSGEIHAFQEGSFSTAVDGAA